MSSSEPTRLQDAASRPEPLTLGAPAPAFTARTTMGTRSLADHRGRWLVFFSHPADFTPVCTSEFIAFARAHDRFQALDCDLLALSVDSLFAHVAWVRSIAQSFGVAIPFPIVEDPSMAIAAAYGMIQPAARDSAAVRATFVIDPAGIIRAQISYPMTTGRSVAEILRLVEALQVADAEAVSTPEGWKPGDDVIAVPDLDLRAVPDMTVADTEEPSAAWFYRTRKRSAR